MIQTIETPLAKEFVDQISSVDSEQGWPTFNQDRLLVASRQFGKACVEASVRDALPDILPIHEQLENIHKNSLELSFQRDRAHLFDISTSWINAWKNPNAREEMQKEIHTETAIQIQKRLEHMDTKSSPAKDQIRGALGELTIMGSINFLEDPNFIALPAPPHHDENYKPANSYDLYLAHISPSGLKSQRVQVKFGCQNLCERPVVQPHKSNDQGKYSSSIAIVSAHCDVGMSRDDLSYADALSRSVLKPETISNDEFDYLFHVGDRLVENLTGADLEIDWVEQQPGPRKTQALEAGEKTVESRPETPEGYERKNIAIKLLANDSIAWTINHDNLEVYEFSYEPERNHVVIYHDVDPGDDGSDMEFLSIRDTAVLNTLKKLGFIAKQNFIPSVEQIEKLDREDNVSGDFTWDLTDLDESISVVDIFDAPTWDKETKDTAHSDVHQDDKPLYIPRDYENNGYVTFNDIRTNNGEVLRLNLKNTLLHRFIKDSSFDYLEIFEAGEEGIEIKIRCFTQKSLDIIEGKGFTTVRTMYPTDIDVERYLAWTQIILDEGIAELLENES